MARSPRDEEPGAIHHVVARGNNKRAIFADDGDRATYLHLLGRSVGKRDWLLLAYALMDNHVHLLVETPRPNLGRGMQRAHGDYAATFNARHHRLNHLWGGRFRNERVRTDGHFWSAVGYIAHNPVAGGLCDAPERWPWSSHGALTTGSAPAWLAHERTLELLNVSGAAPEADYRECVAMRALLRNQERAR